MEPIRTKGAAMTSIASIILDVADTAAAEAFYKSAFDLDTQVRVREAAPENTGFRGSRCRSWCPSLAPSTA
jgi:catechol-2,3-dioxygenase